MIQPDELIRIVLMVFVVWEFLLIMLIEVVVVVDDHHHQVVLYQFVHHFYYFLYQMMKKNDDYNFEKNFYMLWNYLLVNLSMNHLNPYQFVVLH